MITGCCNLKQMRHMHACRLQLTLIAVLAVPAALGGCGPQGAGRGELVVVTLNTHSFQEGPGSLEKLEAIGRGLARLEADLVGLNEVMSGTFWSYHYEGQKHDGAAIIRGALETASGVVWYEAACGFAHWDTGELMSNVILSRTPIEASGCRALTTTDFWPAPGEQRNAAFARTDVAGLGPVHFFAAHPWGWDSVDTLVQVAEIKEFMAGQHRGDEAIDLLAGDLNVTPASQAHRVWLQGEPLALIDTFALANPEGPAGSTLFDQDARVDYILASHGPGLVPDSSSCASRLVFTGEDLPRVSDHRGVVTTLAY